MDPIYVMPVGIQLLTDLPHDIMVKLVVVVVETDILVLLEIPRSCSLVPITFIISLY